MSADASGPLPYPAVDRGPLLVGVLVALAGVAFLVDPLVGAVTVGGVVVRPFVLSAGILAAAFGVGAVVFHRRENAFVARIHVIGAVAWALLFVGVVTGIGTLALLAVGLVLVAALWYVSAMAVGIRPG